MEELDSAPSPSLLLPDADFSLPLGLPSLSATSASTFSSSSSSSSDIEEDVNRGFDRGLGRLHRGFDHWYSGIFYRADVSTLGHNSFGDRDQSLSCVAVVLTFWFFVSMTLILGVYGPTNVWIGPNSSILAEPNPLFVQTIKVKQLDDSKSGLQLFGFYRSPPLDVVVNWSETHSLSVSHDSYKGWPYYFNKGTTLSISYNIKPEGSSVQLVSSQGMEGVSQWLEDSAYHNTVLSWNCLRGSGMMELKMSRSSSYYFAVANLNTEDVEVELDILVRAVLYDTRKSIYKCAFSNGDCTFNTIFPDGNSIVLTSPSQNQLQEVSNEEWYIRFSYAPRWTAYLVSTGLMTFLTLAVLMFWKRFQSAGGERTLIQNDSAEESQSISLLASKDDGGSSMNSSYESLAGDDDDLEEAMGVDGEASYGIRRLCAICFDAPRDCFFLPCGHCVSCYQCGTRIAEAAGSCPICRRKMKKVRRIYTV